MPELEVDVREIYEAGYNVQRREKWCCAIVSSKNGETVLEAVIVKNNVVALNRQTFSCSNKIHIMLKDGKPVAEGGKQLVWAIEAV